MKGGRRHLPAQVMSFFVPWVLIFSASAQAPIDPPKRPQNNLPALEDSFWEKTENWPKTLTNQYGAVYKLEITGRLPDQNRDSHFESFQQATSAKVPFIAKYSLPWPVFNAEPLKKFPEFNPGQTFYGPSFKWRGNGSIQIKWFSYNNGFWETWFLDGSGKVWRKSMTDYIRNSWFGILYDLEGEPIAFSTGADNPDEPYIGETLTLIRGEKSTENTFIDLLHEMKRSRDPRTPRPLPEKQ